MSRGLSKKQQQLIEQIKNQPVHRQASGYDVQVKDLANVFDGDMRNTRRALRSLEARGLIWLEKNFEHSYLTQYSRRLSEELKFKVLKTGDGNAFVMAGRQVLTVHLSDPQ